MRLKLTRQSVAAGDDVDAPHDESLDVRSGSSLRELLALVIGSGYLASISGGKATWSAYEGATPLAVIAQEWAAPKFIAFPEDTYERPSLHIHFKYHAQRSPDDVLAELGREWTRR